MEIATHIKQVLMDPNIKTIPLAIFMSQCASIDNSAMMTYPVC